MPTERLTASPMAREVRELSPGNTANGHGRFKKRSEDRVIKQLMDYTAWVNNYLRRKPGTPLISDIRTDLMDGVCFVNLVEIVAKVQLDGIDRNPIVPSTRRNNIDKAVDFLRLDGVSLHADAFRDILEGNTKGIMRVVLAIAECYQPRSVKPRSSSDPPRPMDRHGQPQTGSSPTYTYGSSSDRYGYAHHPDSSTGPGGSPDRYTSTHSQSPEHPGREGGRSGGEGGRSVGGGGTYARSPLTGNNRSVPNMLSTVVHRPSRRSDPILPTHHSIGYSPPMHAYGALSQPDRPFGIPDAPDPRAGRSYSLSQSDYGDLGEDVYSTPVDQLPPSASPQIIAPDRRAARKKLGVSIRMRSTSMSYRTIPEEPHEPSAMDELSKDMGSVISGLVEFKSELLQLHAMLLHNNDGSAVSPDKDVEPGTRGDDHQRDTTPTNEKTAILGPMSPENMAGTDQLAALQDQLSQLQDEYTQVEAECAALRNMVEERNSFITTMKSEIYRKEYKNDTVKVDLHGQILQKDAVIKKLEDELLSCREALESRYDDISEVKHELEERDRVESEIQAEMERLRAELTQLSSTEDALQSKLAGRDRKVAHLEDKVVEMQEARQHRADQLAEGIDGIREGLSALRGSVGPSNPHQATIDTLEHSISDLMAKMAERTASPTGRKGRRHRESDDHYRERDRDRDREKRSRRHRHIHADGRPEPPYATVGSTIGETTKVFYYMLSEKNDTPYVTVVPKKTSEVTLKDFKSVFDRRGNFKFYCKTQDPDCGMVKEEITREDLPLTAWSGKIIIWIRERERSHHK